MFCDSKNDPDETSPNVNVCPVCMAHPGTLPVVNKGAVRHVLRIGSAVLGQIADYSEFDRKSYFYPDIPKGYQISQYKYPLVVGGTLAGVAITRVHLEEDTARSTHSGGTSVIDFNRAGIPLMELVTEPVITSAEAAGNFARELQLLLRTLGASGANLEKGEMRIEANVSVTRFNLGESDKVKPLGTKVEIKNLNSFRSVERAIAYELARQEALIESGAMVVQETRGWDETKEETFHQRFKEGSADYRYFPEPDIPKLFLSEVAEFSQEALRASLPELPGKRSRRYELLGLKAHDATFITAVSERGTFFDAVVEELGQEREPVLLATNYFISDLAGDPGRATPASFAKLIRLLVSKALSSRGAKDVLALLVAEGGNPEVIAKEHNLIQVHDVTALEKVVDTVLAQEEKAVLQYKSGKAAALQYLVGQSMRESRGAGNPEILRELILQAVSSKQ